jgi:rhodanese-related sulfurtransferase
MVSTRPTEEEVFRSTYVPERENSQSSTTQFTAQQQEAIESFKLLSGEQKIMNIPNCCIQIFAYGNINGVLYITNYRLVFLASPKDIEPIARNNPNIYSYLQVPLGCIDKIEKEKRAKDTLSSMTVYISCKDCRQLRIHMKGSYTNGDYETEKAFNTMTAFAFSNNLRYVFAFNHHFPVPKEGSDLLSEFTRLGVLELGGLRFSNANQDFRLCSTYSETLIVPASVSDADLFTVASFRAGQRLPALCWLKSDNGATLWRCSQPKCGVSGSCTQDEEMLAAIARLTYNNPKFRTKRYNQELVLNIVDCRSRASAMANRAAGAGYESSANYPSCRIDFYNIPNIHAVRDSYKNLLSIVLNPTANPSSDISFSKQVDDTNWITNIRLILKASWDTASMLMSGQPVLVHCSHGWDRTAQVCALSELFLDPYYRTMDGFAVLVEKEWNSFGHTFYARCCQGQDKSTRAEDEVSQIFMQFLDCVWQIQKQFPQYFEFNARYILSVADHVYSCRFGTFLCSSDYERVSSLKLLFLLVSYSKDYLAQLQDKSIDA